MPQPQELPESVTLPLATYQSVLNVLAELPWKQVAQLMPELLKAAQAGGHEIQAEPDEQPDG